MFHRKILLMSLVVAVWPVLIAAHDSEPDSVAIQNNGGGTDSMDNMILIEGGEFLMGKDDKGDAGPAHEVKIGSFYLDAYEVTNTEYVEFCQATERKLPEYWGLEKYHSVRACRG